MIQKETTSWFPSFCKENGYKKLHKYAQARNLCGKEGQRMPARKYAGIYENLRMRIVSGEFPLQTTLPSEYALTAEFSCSRNTVRRAIARLAEEGYVQSVHGKGVVVLYSRGQKRLSTTRLLSFRESAELLHIPYRTEVIRFDCFCIGEEDAVLTGFPVGSEIFKISRIRYVNGEALCVEHNGFLKSVVGDLTREIAEQSVYDYIEKVTGETIVTNRRKFTVELADETDRRYLDLGAYNCVAMVSAHTYNADGVMFEYSEIRYRPDKFEFSTGARRQKN